jgi:hypothetical protein
MPTVIGPNGVPLNVASGGGLLSVFDPDYQAQELQLKQAQAFQDGVPKLQDGSPDYGAMTNRLFQLGDMGGAEKLQQLGMDQQSLNIAGRYAGALGGGQGAGATAGAPALAVPAQGGGMIAPAAGGDDYGRQSGSGSAGQGGGSSTVSGKGVNRDVLTYLRSAFAARGIDPDTAMRVAASEGLKGFDPNGNANLGDDGSSAGPFQLHYGGVASGGNSVAGLGDDFTKATKLDARDSSTWKEQIDFVADHVAKNGWGAFHGAKASNIGAWAGIGSGGQGPAVAAGGPVPAPGQVSMAAVAPSGGQPVGAASPISFNAPQGGGASSINPGPVGAVTDDQVMKARALVTRAQNYDPRMMSPEAQKAVNAATDTIATYERQQAQPAEAASVSPSTEGVTRPDEETAVSHSHPYASDSKGQPLRSNLPSAGAAPVSFGGPSNSPATPPSGGQVALGQGASAVEPSGNTPLANDPGIVSILRSYKGGQFANDPGAALMDMRSAQAALSGGGKYASPVAASFASTANYLEQALTRSATLTNAQRDARDPLVLAEATRKAQMEGEARIQADTDPRRIGFAAAQAGATAAGAAPYKFQATQPVPGGPTVYRSDADLAAAGGAVKDQPAVFGQKQEALGKLDGEMQGQYQQRQVAHERLDAMANLLETFQSGAGADAKAAAIAAVRAAGFQIPDSATANPAAVEQFSKNATANIFSNAKDIGGRVLVSELDGLAKSNANPNMQPASNAAILAQQKGLLNWEDQHYQDYSAWRQANPYATDASGFETAWAKAHPVGAYVAAAKKDIAPLGAPLPAQGQLSDGQAYIVKGQKVRWDAGSSAFVPFSGTTAATLPGQGSQSAGRGQDRQSQPPGQGQATPPVAGARQARDGNWYVPNPAQPGKFMMVVR